MNLNAKHLFFDLDDTLTVNKMVMEDHIYELLRSLPHTKVIVSGANIPQIIEQTRGIPAYRLGQNGNHAFDMNENLLWEELLLADEIEAIERHTSALKENVAPDADAKDYPFFNHGGQASFSLVSHGTERQEKNKFDPDRTLRVKILNEIPSPHENVEIKVAGAASFDYFKKGRNKGFYIQKFIEHMGWDPADCIFFGDSFYPGGNDEPVIGIIETAEVRNHEDTYKHLLEFRQMV